MYVQIQIQLKRYKPRLLSIPERMRLQHNTTRLLGSSIPWVIKFDSDKDTDDPGINIEVLNPDELKS